MKKLGKTRGFTLSEALITVAILAILAAIAVPGVISAARRMKMTELNDTARSIYLAAQNSLTIHRAAGTLGSVETDGSKDDETGLVTLKNGHQGMTALLPTGAIEPAAAGKYYYVVVDAPNGNVLAVYYAEQPFSIGQADTEEERQERRIGYYEGTSLTLPDLDPLPAPVLTVENGEALTLRVNMPDPKVTELTITVTDGVHTYAKNITTDILGKAEWVLDQLSEDESKRFGAVCPGLTPGADLRILATNSGGAGTLPGQSNVVTANSLFAARKGESVHIAAARHLQNLHTEYSGVETGITKAQQTDEILWPSSKYDGKSFYSIYNPSLTFYDGGSLEIRKLRSNPVAGKHVIDNNGLFRKVEGTPTKSVTIQNVRLVNSVIDAPGHSATLPKPKVGGLVGEMSYARIKNCRVYWEMPEDLDWFYGTIYSGFYVGGLVGYAQNSTIVDSFAALQEMSVDGDAIVVGGLVGLGENLTIQNSYASGRYTCADKAQTVNVTVGMFAGSLTGGSVTNCYATGTIEHGAAISGFASGNAAITNSYCAVTYGTAEDKTVKPTRGFGQGGDSTCAYLNLTTPAAADSAQAKPYSEMAGGVWRPLEDDMVWNLAADKETHRYSGTLKDAIYPFPGLAGLPHYGDWPEQTVDNLALYKKGVGEEKVLTPVIIAPTQGAKVFWAQPRVGEDVVGTGLTVNKVVDENGADVSSAQLKAEVSGPAEDGYTPVTLTAQNLPVGVYAVELEAGGAKFWAVVIVPDVTLTLTGTGFRQNSDPSKAVNVAVSGQSAQKEIAMLELGTTKEATFRASITAGLSDAVFAADMTSLIAASGDIALSTGDETASQAYRDQLKTLWYKFRVEHPENGEYTFGPGVTLNPAAVEGGTVHILSSGSGAIYPHVTSDAARTSNALKVTGQAGGVASVSVCWAVDTDVVADCNIQVTGAQVAVKSLHAKGDKKDSSNQIVEGSVDNYPYLLAIEPRPDDALTVTATAELVIAPDPKEIAAGSERYTWSIVRIDENGQPQAVDHEVQASANQRTFKFKLNERLSQARYRISVKYSFDYKGESGKTYEREDFVYLLVTRKTIKAADAENIQTAFSQNAAGDRAQLEQINWANDFGDAHQGVPRPSGAPDTNKTSVYGYVANADDETLIWYLPSTYCQNPAEGNKRISGEGSEIFAYADVDGARIAIAELRWGNQEQQIDGRKSSGGHVEIKALSCDLAVETGFHLIASARDRDATGNGETKDDIWVKILPVMEISPKSQTKIGLFGSTSGSVQAKNRLDGKYEYRWNLQTMEGKAATSNQNDKEATLSITTSGGLFSSSGEGTHRITLTYGPYQDTASYTARRVLEEDTWAVNEDGTVTSAGNERSYFLLPKGEERQLEFSWGTLSSRNPKVTVEPTAETDVLAMARTGGNLSASGSLFSGGFVGNLQYSTTGKNYGYYNAQWTLQNFDIKPSCDIYVVGTEFSQSGKTITGIGTGMNLDLTTYFPAAVGAGTVTITTEPGDSGVIEVNTPEMTPTGAEAETNTITVTSRQYGEVQLVATYTVTTQDGKEYTYQDTCMITVMPEAAPKAYIVPCTAADRGALSAAFGVGASTLPATYANYDAGRLPTVFTDSAFAAKGYDTVYLKAYLTQDGVNGAHLDLTNYHWEFYTDNVGMITVEQEDIAGNRADQPTTYYLRIQAKNGHLNGDSVKIFASFGALAVASQEIKVYSQPSVKIMKGADLATNKHEAVEEFHEGTATPDLTLRAVLEPALLNEQGQALDALDWYVEYPSADYEAHRFIQLTPNTSGSQVNVDYLINPNCKVAITAISRDVARSAPEGVDWKTLPDSKAAYALVFIPKETT